MCRNGCLYCFSKFVSKNNYEEFNENSPLIANKTIYPICDSEIGYQGPEFLDYVLKTIEKLDGDKIVSISTKSNWSDDALTKLKTFNDNNVGKKIVKLSVSFSRKQGLNIFEPNALPYSDRIELLKRLNEFSIPTSVLIKPILPFVEFEEYKSLIDDCIGLCKAFVVGPLYVDKKTKFYKDYIHDRYTLERVYCEWLKSFEYRVDSENYIKIKDYVGSINGICYDSDKDFLEVF